ncbi:MAG: 50S ribosomal protein L23 [Candidatus Cloacimonadota bacterium]|nr:50S ribosomal protein L23 [Candidatus Cloacimonadota bacterium]
MNKHPRKIILETMFTEKSTHLKEDNNCYIFKVDRTANKIEIKNAIQEIFEVKVRKINTMYYKGKPKTLGRHTGRRPAWKKAAVYLERGESIKEFEV